MSAEVLGDGEHQVGGRGLRRQLARELVADDLGQQHRDRLAADDGLSLDTTDSPTNAAANRM